MERQKKTQSRPVRRSFVEQPHLSLLVDVSTRAVLAMSSNVGAIGLLADCTMDSYHIPHFDYPHYLDQAPPSPVGGSLAHWTWNTKTRTLVPTRSDIATIELHASSKLAIAKLNIARRIMQIISTARLRLASGIELQETVYLTKKIQAKGFKDSGYDEASLMEFPYVLQYADLINASPREAADDILLKAKLADDVLGKTELLRLAYFDMLKKARTTDELEPIFENFYREAVVNAII